LDHQQSLPGPTRNNEQPKNSKWCIYYTERKEDEKHMDISKKREGKRNTETRKPSEKWKKNIQ
jgi:hypothetical protein